MFDHRIGHWAFIVGIILAVFAGLVPEWQTVTIMATLAVLGLIVGVLNITARETTEFLIATMTLLIVGTAGSSPAWELVSPKILFILANIVFFVAPAALIVALKAIWALAQD